MVMKSKQTPLSLKEALKKTMLIAEDLRQIADELEGEAKSMDTSFSDLSLSLDDVNGRLKQIGTVIHSFTRDLRNAADED